jgi:hypothetical protein
MADSSQYITDIQKALADRAAQMGSSAPAKPLTGMQHILLQSIPGAAKGYMDAARQDQAGKAQAQQDFMDRMNTIKTISGMDYRDQANTRMKRQADIGNFEKMQSLINSLSASGHVNEAAIVKRFGEQNGVTGLSLPEKSIQIPKEAQSTLSQVNSLISSGNMDQANALYRSSGLSQWGIPPPKDASALTPDAISQGAIAYMNTGKLPYVRGKSGARMQTAILYGVKDLRKSLGLTQQEFSMIPSLDATNKTLLMKQAQNAQFLEATHNTVLQHMDMASNQVKRVFKTGNVGANVGIGFLQRQMGDKDYADFMTTNKMMATEFARLMSSTPSGGGQLTDAARAEADALINPNTPVGTYLSVLGDLKKLMAARIQASRAMRRQDVMNLMNPVKSLRNPSGKLPQKPSPTLNYDPSTGTFIPQGGQ